MVRIDNDGEYDDGSIYRLIIVVESSMIRISKRNVINFSLFDSAYACSLGYAELEVDVAEVGVSIVERVTQNMDDVSGELDILDGSKLSQYPMRLTEWNTVEPSFSPHPYLVAAIGLLNYEYPNPGVYDIHMSITMSDGEVFERIIEDVEI